MAGAPYGLHVLAADVLRGNPWEGVCGKLPGSHRLAV